MMTILGFTLSYLDSFNLFAGLCSIFSLFIACITLNKVTNIRINVDTSRKMNQNMTANNNTNTSIEQTGQDRK